MQVESKNFIVLPPIEEDARAPHLRLDLPGERESTDEKTTGSMTAHISERLLLAFEGTTAPPEILADLGRRPIAGFTYFRESNYASPEQMRELSDLLQSTTSDRLPLLLAVDQEGGQHLALGQGGTEWAGNMALGSVGDTDLAYAVGAAMGEEMRAIGVNVNYAPICDIANNPMHPSLGIRSLGDDPESVGRLAAALTAGMQSAGLAATLKHFPGKGDTSIDTHERLATIDHSRKRMDEIELVPFRKGIAAGAKLIMTGHFAIPSLTEDPSIPATVSRAVMHDLVRRDLGFSGVVVSDALDMGAIEQGVGQIIDVIACVRAEVDLLLFTPDLEMQSRMEAGLELARSRGLLPEDALNRSLARVRELKEWTAGFPQPSLDVVGSQAHRAIAVELAQRSITLVRNDAGLIPLNPSEDQTIVVLQPQPENLTPADTTSFVSPQLAESIRAHHGNVREVIVPMRPTSSEIQAAVDQVGSSDLIVCGTVSANIEPTQASFAQAILALGQPTITVALRTPFDLEMYPSAATHVCTYSILRTSLDALADCLFGARPFQGQLPVAIAGLAPRGHGLSTTS